MIIKINKGRRPLPLPLPREFRRAASRRAATLHPTSNR